MGTLVSNPQLAGESQRQHPLFSLTDEELDLVLQLVLASGSLKDLARVYQVSYPTIRASLDRLIERLKRFANGSPQDSMVQLLADLVERGDIKASTAKSIRDLHRQLKAKHAQESTI